MSRATFHTIRLSAAERRVLQDAEELTRERETGQTRNYGALASATDYRLAYERLVREGWLASDGTITEDGRTVLKLTSGPYLRYWRAARAAMEAAALGADDSGDALRDAEAAREDFLQLLKAQTRASGPQENDS